MAQIQLSLTFVKFSSQNFVSCKVDSGILEEFRENFEDVWFLQSELFRNYDGKNAKDLRTWKKYVCIISYCAGVVRANNTLSFIGDWWTRFAALKLKTGQTIFAMQASLHSLYCTAAHYKIYQLFNPVGKIKKTKLKNLFRDKVFKLGLFKL